MANKYYYLISSLPYLTFEGDSRPAREYFISECRKWLVPRDLTTLLDADISSIEVKPIDTGLIKEWKEFRMDLRKAISEVRSARKISSERRIPDLVKEVFDQGTPLDMEKTLEKMEWDFLEEKEIDYHFDLNWLIVYSLKIGILERLAEFDKERGRQVFEKACEVRYE